MMSPAFWVEVFALWSAPDSITSVKSTIPYPETLPRSSMELLPSINRSASGWVKAEIGPSTVPLLFSHSVVSDSAPP